jgi:hypothetical protein
MANLPLMFTEENARHETISLSNSSAWDEGGDLSSTISTATAENGSSSSSSSSSSPTKTILALPAPPAPTDGDVGRPPTIEINKGNEAVAGGVFKFDELGPMVVNSDGTLSRITNWTELSQGERERTVRLLVKKRNL